MYLGSKEFYKGHVIYYNETPVTAFEVDGIDEEYNHISEAIFAPSLEEMKDIIRTKEFWEEQ